MTATITPLPVSRHPATPDPSAFWASFGLTPAQIADVLAVRAERTLEMIR